MNLYLYTTLVLICQKLLTTDLQVLLVLTVPDYTLGTVPRDQENEELPKKKHFVW